MLSHPRRCGAVDTMTILTIGPFLFTYRVILNDMGDDDRRVTFREKEDKIDYLDKLIALNTAHARLHGNVSRSDLLRQCIDRLIDELEAETEPDLIADYMLHEDREIPH